MSLPTITAEMRVVADPELRFTPSGHAVANFRLVSNGRKFNKATNEYEDDGVCWLSCSAWRQLAENIAETITKGMLVTVTGDLETREYETREGEKRQALELRVRTIGPSLTFASARVTATARPQGQASAQQRPAAQSQPEDPWATPSTTPDEPPF